MIRLPLSVLILVAIAGCAPKEKPLPPLLPETAATFKTEGVPDEIQQSFRKQHPSVRVDKVFKEIVGGELHYFIKYTNPKTGRKGDAEYNEKGEKALPKAQRSS
jgi:hypothetical protein